MLLQTVRGVVGRAGRGRAEVRAEINRNGRAHCQDPGVGIQRELRFDDLMPTVSVGCDRIAALPDQFHRPIELSRRPEDEDVLRIDLALHAEAAADVRRHNSQVEFRHSQDI